MQRIGVDLFDGGGDLGGGGAQVDGVTQRLAHLGLAVDARQAADVRHQRLALHQDVACTMRLKRRTISLVCSIIGIWSSPTGTIDRLEGRDVGRLAGRVGQKAGRDVALEAAQARSRP